LRFSDDGQRASYLCASGGKTYEADLVPLPPLQAQMRSTFSGTVNRTNTPIKVYLAPDRESGILTETSKSGDTVVTFTGIWNGDTLHAVTGAVISKPERVQWQPESFTLRVGDEGRHISYVCDNAGQTLTAELIAP
jgi:hypothetical protein